MAHLYADENFPYPVVEELRALGHDVVTVQERGHHRITDLEVLTLATKDGRAVLTINRKHFIPLHRASTEHAGMVLCTLDAPAFFERMAARIDAAIADKGDLTGQQVRVTRPPG